MSAVAKPRLRWSSSALIAAAAMGPLLIGSALYSQRAVSHAGEKVLRGEAEFWARLMESRLQTAEGRSTPAMLETLVQESRGEGLRYVGYFWRDGRLEGGTPATAVDPDELIANRPVVREGLVRFAISTRPPRPPHHEGPPPGFPHHQGERREFHDGPPPNGPPPPTWLVVEFEPRTWGELNRTAQRTLLRTLYDKLKRYDLS